jgi:CheY-like chemotaxis protein
MTTQRILIVDDDDGGRLTLAANLELDGYEVVTAGSGAEAVRLVREAGPFALVITDFRMPEMDGLDTLRAIREVAPGVRVVIATGFAEESRVDAAITEGAFAVLTKPICMERALRVLAHALSGPVVVVVDEPGDANALVGALNARSIDALACTLDEALASARPLDGCVVAVHLAEEAKLRALASRAATRVTLVYVTNPRDRPPRTAALPGFVVHRPIDVPWLARTMAQARATA